MSGPILDLCNQNPPFNKKEHSPEIDRKIRTDKFLDVGQEGS